MSSGQTNPFESPQTIDASTATYNLQGRKRYAEFESGHARAVFAMAMLLAVMVADVFYAGSTYLQIGLAERVRAGRLPTPAEAVENAARHSRH